MPEDQVLLVFTNYCDRTTCVAVNATSISTAFNSCFIFSSLCSRHKKQVTPSLSRWLLVLELGL
jgi:hypothetical protein